MEKDETKDFGTANGWLEVPPIIKRCRASKHKITERNLGRCLTEISCSICGYKYRIDSSD